MHPTGIHSCSLKQPMVSLAKNGSVHRDDCVGDFYYSIDISDEAFLTFSHGVNGS